MYIVDNTHKQGFSTKYMLDIGIVGPSVLILSITDVVLHIYLDATKARRQTNSQAHMSDVKLPTHPLQVAGGATILSFLIVCILSLIWIMNINVTTLQYFVFLIDPIFPIWITGFLFLCSGILLHGWSRFVRKNMASNWEMSEEQSLFTNGPYSRIRHPSYTSYFLSFTGLFLLIPSLLTMLSLFGIWGYYRIAVKEEEHLLKHFGDAYSQYMLETGRFFPSLSTKSTPRESPKA
ncbi:MAG: methyltransferase family protein [Candidatus Thorarchaeota archaeon]